GYGTGIADLRGVSPPGRLRARNIGVHSGLKSQGFRTYCTGRNPNAVRIAVVVPAETTAAGLSPFRVSVRKCGSLRVRHIVNGDADHGQELQRIGCPGIPDAGGSGMADTGRAVAPGGSAQRSVGGVCLCSVYTTSSGGGAAVSECDGGLFSEPG